MSWTVTDWSAVPATALLQDPTYLDEIYAAIAERQDNNAPTTITANEQTIQDKTIWQGIQTAIESLLVGFVVSHSDGVRFDRDHYDTAESIPTYADLADLMTCAGLSHTDWRRYTVHPSEGGTPSYGQVEVGDIHGWWLYDDAKRCLDALVWVLRGLADTDSQTYNGSGDEEGTSALGDTAESVWAASKAEAEAGWTTYSPGPTFNIWHGAYGLNTSYVIGSDWYYRLLTQLWHMSAKMICSTDSPPFEYADCHARALIKGGPPGSAHSPPVEETLTFDAQGNTIITNGTFALFGTLTIPAGEYGDFGRFNESEATMPPNWCDMPPNNPPDASDNVLGWTIVESVTLCQLDVDGGLEYVA
jgi:hypothetical protein